MTQLDIHRTLGASGITVPPLGIGTNRWGAKNRDDEAVFQAFQTYLDMGLNFMDTAEVYTGGNSEKLIGNFTKRDERPVIIASKFAPLPNRLSPHTLIDALDATLQRLQRKTIDLYFVHFPYTFLNLDALMDEMALAVHTGKIRAVGVSNYNAQQMRRAAARLARYNIPLAANEVHYSLFHRQPETNGVLDTCRELNVALIAYRPLASSPDRKASTNLLGRNSKNQDMRVALQETLKTIASNRGKTVSQVMLNWLLHKDEHIIPIPGATSASHAKENGETLEWQLTDDEFSVIDKACANFA